MNYQELRDEIKTAMKAKDKVRLAILRQVLGEIKNIEVNERREITDADVDAMLKRTIKQTKETMELAPEDREDIKEACEKRLAVYQEFAPEEMSEEAVLAEVKAVLAALAIDAPSMKDKGKVMKELMPKVKGRADGGMVNKIVGEVLNGEK